MNWPGSWSPGQSHRRRTAGSTKSLLRSRSRYSKKLKKKKKRSN